MKKFYKDLSKYFYYAIYAAKVDLKAEVANSYLNWIWWILEPVFVMLIFTYVFGTLFANSELYFPVFIYSGLIMWDFFARTANYSVSLVRKNKQIITKVYVPKFILLLENMFLNFIKLMIAWIVLFFMMFAFGVPFTAKILYIIPIYLIYFIFSFGIGTILLHFGVFVDDLSYVVAILLRFLFYISGVFYNIEKRFPATEGRLLEVCNPLAAMMKAMHNVLMYNTNPDFKLLFFWLVVSILISIIGIKTVYKYENSYVKVI